MTTPPTMPPAESMNSPTSSAVFSASPNQSTSSASANEMPAPRSTSVAGRSTSPSLPAPSTELRAAERRKEDQDEQPERGDRHASNRRDHEQHGPQCAAAVQRQRTDGAKQRGAQQWHVRVYADVRRNC